MSPVLKGENKAPAEVQITAEQLLREAKERELELLPPPQQKITDEEELNDYNHGRGRLVCFSLSISLRIYRPEL